MLVTLAAMARVAWNHWAEENKVRKQVFQESQTEARQKGGTYKDGDRLYAARINAMVEEENEQLFGKDWKRRWEHNVRNPTAMAWAAAGVFGRGLMKVIIVLLCIAVLEEVLVACMWMYEQVHK